MSRVCPGESGGSFCGGNAGKIDGKIFSSRKLLGSSRGQVDAGTGEEDGTGETTGVGVFGESLGIG